MEKEIKPKTEQEILGEFQKEMESLRQTQKEEGVAHFEGLNSAELTPDDMLIWQKINDKSLTPEELTAYSEKLKEEAAGKSRTMFLHFINNKAVDIFGERQMEEMEKRGEAGKLDISELTKEDLSILKKMDDRNITPEELKTYLEKFENEKDTSRTRKVFVELIRNRAKFVLRETK